MGHFEKLEPNQEFVKFVRQCLSLGEIAKDVGKQANYVLSKLNKQNINRIELPKHCNRIYRRRQIPSDIFD